MDRLTGTDGHPGQRGGGRESLSGKEALHLDTGRLAPVLIRPGLDGDGPPVVEPHPEHLGHVRGGVQNLNRRGSEMLDAPR
ncbi:hypothetical protein ACWKSP_12985 [Micromonosporaceae bacterium Da 78-11]